jgi:hypothetical protein
MILLPYFNGRDTDFLFHPLNQEEYICVQDGEWKAAPKVQISLASDLHEMTQITDNNHEFGFEHLRNGDDHPRP